jgi:hypothetical protein
VVFRRTTLRWSPSGPSPNESIEAELYTFRNAGQCMTARPRAAARAYGSRHPWHVQLQVHMTLAHLPRFGFRRPAGPRKWLAGQELTTVENMAAV